MPDTPSGHQILNYSSRCYHNNLGRQDDLAKGYLAIVDQTHNIIQGAHDPTDLLAWLKRAHSDSSLLKACKGTLTNNGG